MPVGRERRYCKALSQMSCLSLVGAVNFISRWGVDTMTLYWCNPGGIGLGSNTDRTPSMYALLALDSDTFDDPGSAELQYKVLVYGCTQKNRLCLACPCPFPIVRRVYLYKNSPIIVCVIAWMMAGSVVVPLARGVVSAVLLGVAGSGRGCARKWSDDMDERGDAMLRSDISDVCENCRLSRSRALRDDNGGEVACCAYAAALAADLKLLVDGNWRKFACDGGMLEPAWRKL